MNFSTDRHKCNKPMIDQFKHQMCIAKEVMLSAKKRFNHLSAIIWLKGRTAMHKIYCKTYRGTHLSKLDYLTVVDSEDLCRSNTITFLKVLKSIFSIKGITQILLRTFHHSLTNKDQMFSTKTLKFGIHQHLKYHKRILILNGLDLQ